MLPNSIKDTLVTVEKQSSYNGASNRNCDTYDKIWVPSYKELFDGTNKYQINNLSKHYGINVYRYWLRDSTEQSRNMLANGATTSVSYASDSSGVVFGFCIDNYFDKTKN